MAQQINLMHTGLKRRREPFGSRDAVLLATAALGLVALGAFGLRHLAERDAQQAAQADQALAALRVRIAAVAPAGPSRSTLELERLRTLEAGQRQVLAAIGSGSAGRAEGYAEFFMALSRQARPTLWITGLNVGADGRTIELQGRLADPKLLPDYLRRLGSEAAFRGRDFAQLSLKSADAGADGTAAFTEFLLRSTAAATEAGQ